MEDYGQEAIKLIQARDDGGNGIEWWDVAEFWI